MIRRALLNVETLGDRVMPSAGLPAVAPAGTAPVSAAQALPPLSGTAHGHYRFEPGNPDAGRTTTLEGTADLAGVGHVALTGSVNAVGMIASGHAGGTLTLSGAGSTITLKLTGAQQPGFAPLPGRFGYEVVGGTGSFAAMHSAGTIYLNLTQNGTGYFTLAVRPGESHTGGPAAASGISGEVRIGPVSPVARPGEPDSRPLPGALVTVRTADGNEVAHQTTDAGGKFRLALEPGTYSVTVSPPSATAGVHNFRLWVIVRAGQFGAPVAIKFDSGIR